MRTTTGLPEQINRTVPVLAFGLSLVISSGVGAVVGPTHLWTQTPVAEFRAPAPALAGTSTGVSEVSSQHAVGARPAADDVVAVRALSGLTTEQVAKLFGVTRRSVHNWIAGDAMAPHHRERLDRMLALVQSTPGTTPSEKRASLLDSSQGPSLFHQLTAVTLQYAATRATVPTVRDRLHA